MGAHCSGESCGSGLDGHLSPRYRKILWFVFFINAAMFVVEMLAGVKGDSVSLMTDALDFLSDAANYLITLAVLSMGLRQRAIAAFVKGVSMGVVGLWALGMLVYHAVMGSLPDAPLMGTIGIMALFANVLSAFVLYRYREGDSNMRSVWICSRNDAIGNIAVVFAAVAVYFVGHGWPDLTVAAIMASLALHGAWQIMTHAKKELKEVGSS